MLFYHHRRSCLACATGYILGVPQHTKPRKLVSKCSCAADLCKIAAHCHQQSPTWRHRAPKYTPKLTFRSSEGHFSSKSRDSGPSKNTLFIMFSYHLARCGRSFFARTRLTPVLKTLCQRFSLLAVPGPETVPKEAPRAPQRRSK